VKHKQFDVEQNLAGLKQEEPGVRISGCARGHRPPQSEAIRLRLPKARGARINGEKRPGIRLNLYLPAPHKTNRLHNCRELVTFCCPFPTHSALA
jgi:hypothetical protein